MNTKVAFRLRALAIAMAIVLLTSAYYRIHSASMMAETANNFLVSLTPEQRAIASFQFDAAPTPEALAADERLNWHYIPRVRKGLPLRDMTPPQRALAHALLNAGVSHKGFIKAASIMSLEDVLKGIEKGTGPVRDPEAYFFSIFGEPSENGTWGYRVEGHHMSLNFTIVKGKVAGTPSFFGSNPAEVREGPRKGLRVLGREEDLGRELLLSLDAGQKAIAIVSKDAPKEILTEATRQAALKGQASGLSAAKMNAHQRELLHGLLEDYCYDFPEQLAQARLDEIKQAGNNVSFAWEGVEERGGPHYYRIQAPSFLVEYDNTQNNANHIHTVWRDFAGDFGLDLLGMHYQASHGTH